MGPTGDPGGHARDPACARAGDCHREPEGRTKPGSHPEGGVHGHPAGHGARARTRPTHEACGADRMGAQRHMRTSGLCERTMSRAGCPRRADHHAARTGDHHRQRRPGTGGPDGRDTHREHDDGNDEADSHAERAAARANEDGQSTPLRRGMAAYMHTDNYAAQPASAHRRVTELAGGACRGSLGALAHRVDHQGALPADVYSRHGNRCPHGSTVDRQPSPARATPAHSMPSNPRAPRSSHDACPHLRYEGANGSNPLVGSNETPFGRGFVVR